MMDFLIFLARYYICIGMVVVIIYWVWNKLQLFKEIGEKGIASVEIKPVGLDNYLYVWFVWPKAIYVFWRVYRSRRVKSR